MAPSSVTRFHSGHTLENVSFSSSYKAQAIERSQDNPLVQMERASLPFGCWTSVIIIPVMTSLRP